MKGSRLRPGAAVHRPALCYAHQGVERAGDQGWGSRVVWVTAVFLAGCQSSYLQARGAEALRRGDRLQAIANYRAAIEARRPASDPELVGEVDRLTTAWFDERMAALEGGASDQARAALMALAQTPWLPEADRAKVQVVLQSLYAQRWPVYQAELSAGRGWAAVRQATFELGATQDPELLRRLTELRSAAAAIHLQAASAAVRPAVVALHQRVALALGASLSAPPRIPGPGLRLEIAEGCAELGAALRQSFAEGAAADPLLRVDHCGFKEERDVLLEPYVGERLVPEVYTATVWREEGGVLTPRKVTAERVGIAPVPRVRRVLRRRLEVEVGAHFLGRPLEDRLTHESRAFWSPEGSAALDPVDRLALMRALADRLSQQVRAQVIEAAGRQAEEALRAGLAAGNSEPIEAAALALLAAGRSMPEAGARYFLERYGLTAAEVSTFAADGTVNLVAIPSAPVTLPTPEYDDEEEAWARTAAGRVEVDDRADLRVGDGVDVYAVFFGAPLVGRANAHGLGARVRGDGVELSVAGAVPMLGGEVEGVRLRLAGWSHVDEEEVRAPHPLRIGYGVGFETWRAQDGARSLGLGLPLTLSLQVAPPVLLEAGVFLNAAQLKDLISEDPTDPAHPSPVHLAMTMGARHLYARGELAYDLGLNQGLRGGLEIGARF